MSFFRKAFLVNSAEFISLGIAVLQSVVLTRFLGPAGIGQYTIITAVLLLAPQICSFGVPLSLLYHSQHDPENRVKYLMHAFWAILFLGIPGGFILVFLLFFKANYFGSVTLLALIGTGCYVPMVLVHSIARSALLIKIEARKLSLLRIIPMICGVFLVVILFVLGMLTASRAITCLVLSELVAMVLGLFWARRYIDFSLKFNWGTVRKLGLMGIRLNWMDLMLLVNAQLNIFIVKYLLDDFESVGYFSRGQRIAMLIVLVGRTITPLLFSRWASLPEDKLAMHVEKVMRFSSTICVIGIVGLLLSGKWVILILYGKEFLPALQPMMILLPGAALYLLSRIFIPLLSSRGRPEVVIIALLIGAAINVVLCWFLIPSMDIFGAAWASTVGNIILLLLLVLMVKKMKYGIRVSYCIWINREDIGSMVKSLLGKSG
ncbi:MAG: oligosaccharide flippase family protein [Sedimentisphaerales bacterium]|nr:oligosaccharide flippase family protein [Sedimentisphaerales bacterium]